MFEKLCKGPWPLSVEQARWPFLAPAEGNKSKTLRTRAHSSKWSFFWLRVRQHPARSNSRCLTDMNLFLTLSNSACKLCIQRCPLACHLIIRSSSPYNYHIKRFRFDLAPSCRSSCTQELFDFCTTVVREKSLSCVIIHLIIVSFDLIQVVPGWAGARSYQNPQKKMLLKLEIAQRVSPWTACATKSNVLITATRAIGHLRSNVGDGNPSHTQMEMERHQKKNSVFTIFNTSECIQLSWGQIAEFLSSFRTRSYCGRNCFQTAIWMPVTLSSAGSSWSCNHAHEMSKLWVHWISLCSSGSFVESYAKLLKLTFPIRLPFSSVKHPHGHLQIM